ncbi:hypothetical protein BDF20DRAFT_887762 [Mycotypha africana]|uniref:uncharacterized protein n=1 Tax=Mycotypha africana TaxID=64632 RepID=UPI0022FFFB8F|nr:uncharacterized protein BDF20DRAFT_887762 [Mycotypha africana]KAI8971986.1 hypothetical protein BDF20DRAFT_887762 [Mycotypha africana]
MLASRIISIFVVLTVLTTMVMAKKHKSKHKSKHMTKHKKKIFTTSFPVKNNDVHAHYRTKTLPASIFPTFYNYEIMDSNPLKDGQVYLSAQDAGYKV